MTMNLDEEEKYECIVLHVSLDALEHLGEVRGRPDMAKVWEMKPEWKPFVRRCKMRSKWEYKHLSLVMVEDPNFPSPVPCVAVMQYPETIVLKQLDATGHDSKIIIRCQRFNGTHEFVSGRWPS